MSHASSLIAKLTVDNQTVSRMKFSEYKTLSAYIVDMQLYYAQCARQTRSPAKREKFEYFSDQTADLIVVMRKLNYREPLNKLNLKTLKNYPKILDIMRKSEVKFVTEAERNLEAETRRNSRNGTFDQVKIVAAADWALEKIRDCNKALQAIDEIGYIFKIALEEIKMLEENKLVPYTGLPAAEIAQFLTDDNKHVGEMQQLPGYSLLNFLKTMREHFKELSEGEGGNELRAAKNHQTLNVLIKTINMFNLKLKISDDERASVFGSDYIIGQIRKYVHRSLTAARMEYKIATGEYTSLNPIIYDPPLNVRHIESNIRECELSLAALNDVKNVMHMLKKALAYERVLGQSVS